MELPQKRRSLLFGGFDSLFHDVRHAVMNGETVHMSPLRLYGRVVSNLVSCLTISACWRALS